MNRPSRSTVLLAVFGALFVAALAAVLLGAPREVWGVLVVLLVGARLLYGRARREERRRQGERGPLAPPGWGGRVR